jgi:hypothetical protein
MRTVSLAIVVVLTIATGVSSEFRRFQFKLPDLCTTGPCAWDYIYEHYANWQNDTVADQDHCRGAKVRGSFGTCGVHYEECAVYSFPGACVVAECGFRRLLACPRNWRCGEWEEFFTFLRPFRNAAQHADRNQNWSIVFH